MGTMMRIAEVSERSGFPAPTLRYYEDLGLVTPADRTPAGYRMYDESVFDRLAFIARAKSLGCSLEEIAGLMPEWDGGECAPVQARLGTVAAAKLGDARARRAELEAFIGDLRRILASLHAPAAGPCTAGCGCLGDAPTPAPPVACTLDGAALPGRIREWTDLLAHATARHAVDGGVRIDLDPSTPVDQLARLVVAEQSCCPFFAFAFTCDERGIGLEVRAPAGAQDVIASILDQANIPA